MIGDSVSMTYDGATVTLPKIGTEINGTNIKTTYRNAAGTLEVIVAHERQNPAFKGGPQRIRRLISFTRYFTATDPFTAQVKQLQSSASLVLNDLVWGIEDADLKKIELGLISLAGVSGLIDKVLGDES